MERRFNAEMRPRCERAAGLVLAAALLATAAAADGPRHPGVAAAERTAGIRVDPPRLIRGTPISLTCFEGPLSTILNVGCFNPPTPGDRVSHSTHFFVQDIVPNFAAPMRITGFGFISNDGATVFPSCGIVLVPFSADRFPSPTELANLQVHNVPTPHDTAIVTVDLRAFDLQVQSNTDVYVCIQFPEGGTLVDTGNGPGVFVDAVAPDPNCDFLTADTGTSYFRPAVNDPLDWGFEVLFEPVAVEPQSWSNIKTLYGGQRIFPYKSP